MPLPTIFFGFLDIAVNGSRFSSNRNVFLNEFSIPASGNRLFVQLKQYSLIQRFHFCWQKTGDQIFEKYPYSQKWKLIFWLVGTIFFPSIFRYSCYCQLYFSVWWIHILKCIPVGGKGFSDSWKHQSRTFQPFLPVIYADTRHLFQILHSGQ